MTLLAALYFRPIVAWPAEFTRDRMPSPFRATYVDTMIRVREEAGRLGATEAIVHVALTADEFRADGAPSRRARPSHPGVIVSIPTADGGPITLATDVFEARWDDGAPAWHVNLRAVALALEDLRRLDRYGISRRGQQYAGFRELGAGTPMGQGGPEAMTLDDAARTLLAAADIAGIPPAALIDEPEVRAMVYRKAALRTHPDHTGGDPAEFKRVEAANSRLCAAR